MLRHGWRKWVVLFACATLFGLFFASQSYLLYKGYNQKSIPLLPIVVLSLVQTWAWFVLAPGILAVARRFPLERKSLARSLSIHLLAGALFAVAHIVVRMIVTSYLPWSAPAPGESWATRFQGLFLSSFHSGLLGYWAIVGTWQALSYRRKLEERELRASQLEARLAQAQLQVLRIQLHPHFLFNTLHAISALVHKDADAADLMITRLSDLLRMTLENAGAQEVTLQQELDFLQRYIDIEQTRFQDRLTVRLSIAPDVGAARVPGFLLQPLVENAIRHGIAPRSQPGHIDVVASRENGMLQMRIQDNGGGFSGSADTGQGVGLGNTRARLQQLYGAEHQFEAGNAPGGGAVVRLRIPFRISAMESGEVPA